MTLYEDYILGRIMHSSLIDLHIQRLYFIMFHKANSIFKYYIQRIFLYDTYLNDSTSSNTYFSFLMS